MIGETAALCAALLWAFSSVLFADIGKHIRAVNINLLKGIFACLLMTSLLACGTIFGADGLDLGTIISISPEGLFLLLLSGVIGIAIGDTAYFACLRRIGPQNSLMLESTAPIMAAVMALLLYQEILKPSAWIGIFLTTAGVGIVIKWSHSSLGYSTNLPGILYGMLAALCQATGIVLSRKALLADEVEPLASGLVRLAAAVSFMSFWFLLRDRLPWRSTANQTLSEAIFLIKKHNLLLRLLGAITLGTFLAIWLMQTSVKYTSAGITQTLLATCPLFGMIIGLFQGQRQVPLVWCGLFLGIFGISLLFLT
ncbi:MAG: DMT family transporter [Desulfopila sp.]|jgi:drug/metabolite transporter (DMT)-like permease|nr:DMT family transporter [Desulfopila sp.]